MIKVDHLGNVYPTQKAMCDAYGINSSTFNQRIKKSGMTVEEALTKPTDFYQHTGERDAFIRDNYMHMSREELTKAYNEKFGENRSVRSICTYCKRNGYKKWSNIGVEGYTKEEDEWLLENAKLYSCPELSRRMMEIFGRKHSDGSLKQHCRASLGIKKAHGLVYDTTPKNKAPIGSISRWGCRKTIKIDETSGPGHDGWVSYGRYIYEQAHGKLPDDYQVIHIDGDQENFDLNNLLAVNRKEHAILSAHRWHGKGDITKTGVKYAKLTLKLKEMRG